MWHIIPESNEIFSGVREQGILCSTSTWISSVSSGFLLYGVPLEERGLFLSLLCLLSPGSLRSSKSREEDSTGQKKEKGNKYHPLVFVFLFQKVQWLWKCGTHPMANSKFQAWARLVHKLDQKWNAPKEEKEGTFFESCDGLSELNEGSRGTERVKVLERNHQSQFALRL